MNRHFSINLARLLISALSNKVALIDIEKSDKKSLRMQNEALQESLTWSLLATSALPDRGVKAARNYFLSPEFTPLSFPAAKRIFPITKIIAAERIQTPDGYDLVLSDVLTECVLSLYRLQNAEDEIICA